jgi:hypothetical protein
MEDTLMTAKDFRIGDKVSFCDTYIGTIDYSLANGLVLIKEVIGISRSWCPDHLELTDGPRQSCPTRDKIQEALDVVGALLDSPKCNKRLLRVRDLLLSALNDYFSAEDDVAELPSGRWFDDDVDNELVGQLQPERRFQPRKTHTTVGVAQRRPSLED